MPIHGQTRSMMRGLAPGWPLAWPWLSLGLALAGTWPGPGCSWPGPWLALGLALGWILAWPLAGPVQTGSGSNEFRFRPVPVQTSSSSDRFGSSGSGSILSLPDNAKLSAGVLGSSQASWSSLGAFRGCLVASWVRPGAS